MGIFSAIQKYLKDIADTPPVMRPVNLTLFWLIVAAVLAPWAWLQFNNNLNSDVAWLTIAAGRFLDGYKATDFIYEPNPPLAYLFHIPIVLMNRAFGIPLYIASSVYFCLFVLAGAYAVHKILSGWTFLSRADQLVIWLAFILSNTLLSSLDFGERDQILVLGLFPFTLLQLAITRGWPVPKHLKYPIFYIGTLLILLKSHHGFLPAMLLLHRMIAKRRFFSIVKDPDFQALALMSAACLAGTMLFFPGYVHRILPDVLALYYPVNNSNVPVKSACYAFIALIFLLCGMAVTTTREKQSLITALLLCALLSIVPYATQMRGYHYHLIAYIAYLSSGIALILSSHLQRFIKDGYALPLQAAAMAILSAMIIPYNFAYPTHSLYTRSRFPLAAVIEKNSPDKTCPFFLFNDSMEFTHQISLYSGRTNASRFPVFWFLPALLKAEYDTKTGQISNIPADIATEKKRRFADMVGEDLTKWRPCVLLIERYHPREENFDFAGYFSVSPVFTTAWKNYRPAGTVQFNRKDFFPNMAMNFNYPMTFDIYILNPNAAAPDSSRSSSR